MNLLVVSSLTGYLKINWSKAEFIPSDEFFGDTQGFYDWLLTSAEGGSALTWFHPSFSVDVPRPETITVPSPSQSQRAASPLPTKLEAGSTRNKYNSFQRHYDHRILGITSDRIADAHTGNRQTRQTDDPQSVAFGAPVGLRPPLRFPGAGSGRRAYRRCGGGVELRPGIFEVVDSDLKSGSSGSTFGSFACKFFPAPRELRQGPAPARSCRRPMLKAVFQQEICTAPTWFATTRVQVEAAVSRTFRTCVP